MNQESPGCCWVEGQFIWSLIFGVVAVCASILSSTIHRPHSASLGLLGTGLGRLILGTQRLAQAKLARSDGILERFGVHVLAGVHRGTKLVTTAAILGLSLAFFPAFFPA